MIKYIIGGVLVVLAWALAFIFSFSVWIPTGVTLIVGLTILLSLGIDRLKERRAARELEKALAAQAAHQASTVRPDLQHEVAEMQNEFQKAVAALKTSKKGGNKALYALPWYTIIGPPGCGKSTALRNSGLQFPYLSASGGGVRGLGGTRNCDWWMTSEAVILDTAGRWTSEDDDRDEWLSFLDLVKRFRPKKPLNGIIAAVSVGDLGGAREEEVVTLARRIRDRIDEVQGRLALSLPVYVLFTKSDLIPGFVETFGEMPKDDRGQVWGFTAPLTKKFGTPAEFFAKGFDTLVAMLERRSLKRMGEERKIASREMIYAFPQQLAVLRQNLGEFVHQLFSENVFRETPRLRGVYFTSGTQEGRPIDRLMSAMAGAFGQPQIQLPTPQMESKSYFLRDLFNGIVFKDAGVAVRSPEEIARQRRRTYIAAGLVFLLALGISGLPAIAWARNRAFLDETRRIYDSTRDRTAADTGGPIEPADLEPFRARMMELKTYSGIAGPDPFMQMGMYQDELYQPMHDVYLDLLRERVVGPLVAADAAEMEAFARRCEALGSAAHPEAQELRETYNRLKLHLLLTRPQGEHEPPLDGDLRDFIQTQLLLRWARATETPRSDPHYDHIRANLEYYIDELDDRPELFFERDPTAVGRVRGVFSAVGGFDMAVQGIVEEVRPRGADMTVQRMLGRGVTMLRGRERVRFAFTFDGWDRHVRHMLETDAPRFFGEHWVLGHPPPESEREAEIERQQQVEGLRSYFLEQYVAEWMRFIEGLEYGPSTSDQDAFVLLAQLTSGDPMRLTALFRSIRREVSIESEAASPGRGTSLTDMARQRAMKRLGKRNAAIATAAGNRLAPNVAPPANAMTPERVRERFVGFLDFSPPETATPDGQIAQTTPCAQYEEQLEFLSEALRFKLDGTNVTNYAQRQAEARSFTEILIAQRVLEWQPRFRTLLVPPINGFSPSPVAPTVPAGPTTMLRPPGVAP